MALCVSVYFLNALSGGFLCSSDECIQVWCVTCKRKKKLGRGNEGSRDFLTASDARDEAGNRGVRNSRDFTTALVESKLVNTLGRKVP